MSLHAQLCPEAEARLRAQRRNSTISSLFISVLVLILMGLVLAFIFLPSLLLESPTIVSYNAASNKDDELQQKEINNQIQRKPSAPSSSMAKVIASTTPSPTAIPVPEVDVPDPSADFGSGDDFGDGWGNGADGGPGGFSNIPATMRKRCSKEDRLQRLAENGGTPECEEQVVATLDWLQKTQNKDGSWCSSKQVAMTGLALLTYLGHCETPLSEQYGETVTAAITYLVNVGIKNKGKLADDIKDKHWPYEHAIATYAIAEAYTFCNQLSVVIPNLKETVQESGQWIINNQHQSGSWDYSYAEDSPRGGDNSIGCWHLQALKACKHTGLDFRNLDKCVREALEYIKNSQVSSGAIGYSGTGFHGKYSSLAGAGALAFQMWGKTANSVPRNACRYVGKEVPFQWNTADCDLYALYYNAQAMINYGGETWAKYNKMFLPEILKNQNPDGTWKDLGGGAAEINAVAPQFKGASGLSVHYRTCLAALTLEVYYRFLPGTGAKTK